MSDQVEMEEDDRGTVANTTNQGGEKKRFEVKKVNWSDITIEINNRNIYLFF